MYLFCRCGAHPISTYLNPRADVRDEWSEKACFAGCAASSFIKAENDSGRLWWRRAAESVGAARRLLLHRRRRRFFQPAEMCAKVTKRKVTD